jgi:hypothetical protein
MVGMLTVVLAAGVGPARAWGGPEEADPTEAQGRFGPRVRGGDPIIAATIADATDRSPTFRHLVERIQGTNGLVYVARGRCGHGVYACLPHVIALAGPNRVLVVFVEKLDPESTAIGAIAHELRHALEVLDDRLITTSVGMLHFYRSHGFRQGDAFETTAAIAAQDAVLRELRRRAKPLANQPASRRS